jgi:hypothetical protein
VLEAKDDVTLQAARITSGDTTEITAADGQVAMLVTKDSKYERKVKSDMGFFSWSSKDEGSVDETVQHTEINAAGGLTITTAEENLKSGDTILFFLCKIWGHNTIFSLGVPAFLVAKSAQDSFRAS